MHTQLRSLSTLFDEHGVTYWIESGTLLTLYRSGHLTPYDDDIDIAVWADELESIDALLPAIERLGYDVQIRTYDGHPYKYQFIPTSQHGTSEMTDQRLIDLMVFRRTDGHAWTAQSRLTPDLSIPLVSRALELSTPVIERYAQSTAGRMEMTAFPKRLLTDVLTLWIPLPFVDSRQFDADLGVPTPVEPESYLAFRYGDWETPVEDWSLTDDRAITQRDPGSLFADAHPPTDFRTSSPETAATIHETVANDS